MQDTVNAVVFDGRPFSIEDVADIAHRRRRAVLANDKKFRIHI